VRAGLLERSRQRIVLIAINERGMVFCRRVRTSSLCKGEFFGAGAPHQFRCDRLERSHNRPSISGTRCAGHPFAGIVPGGLPGEFDLVDFIITPSATGRDTPLLDRHPLASVGTLVLGLRCSWCPGSAPMPKILGLHALPPAATAVGSMG
jgi:hypothetical protein